MPIANSTIEAEPILQAGVMQDSVDAVVSVDAVTTDPVSQNVIEDLRASLHITDELHVAATEFFTNSENELRVKRYIEKMIAKNRVMRRASIRAFRDEFEDINGLTKNSKLSLTAARQYYVETIYDIMKSFFLEGVTTQPVADIASFFDRHGKSGLFDIVAAMTKIDCSFDSKKIDPYYSTVTTKTHSFSPQIVFNSDEAQQSTSFERNVAANPHTTFPMMINPREAAKTKFAHMYVDPNFRTKKDGSPIKNQRTKDRIVDTVKLIGGLNTSFLEKDIDAYAVHEENEVPVYIFKMAEQIRAAREKIRNRLTKNFRFPENAFLPLDVPTAAEREAIQAQYAKFQIYGSDFSYNLYLIHAFYDEFKNVCASAVDDVLKVVDKAYDDSTQGKFARNSKEIRQYSKEVLEKLKSDMLKENVYTSDSSRFAAKRSRLCAIIPSTSAFFPKDGSATLTSELLLSMVFGINVSLRQKRFQGSNTILPQTVLTKMLFDNTGEHRGGSPFENPLHKSFASHMSRYMNREGFENYVNQTVHIGVLMTSTDISDNFMNNGSQTVEHSAVELFSRLLAVRPKTRSKLSPSILDFDECAPETLSELVNAVEFGSSELSLNNIIATTINRIQQYYWTGHSQRPSELATTVTDALLDANMSSLLTQYYMYQMACYEVESTTMFAMMNIRKTPTFGISDHDIGFVENLSLLVQDFKNRALTLVREYAAYDRDLYNLKDYMADAFLNFFRLSSLSGDHTHQKAPKILPFTKATKAIFGDFVSDFVLERHAMTVLPTYRIVTADDFELVVSNTEKGFTEAATAVYSKTSSLNTNYMEKSQPNSCMRYPTLRSTDDDVNAYHGGKYFFYELGSEKDLGLSKIKHHNNPKHPTAFYANGDFVSLFVRDKQAPHLGATRCIAGIYDTSKTFKGSVAYDVATNTIIQKDISLKELLLTCDRMRSDLSTSTQTRIVNEACENDFIVVLGPMYGVSNTSLKFSIDMIKDFFKNVPADDPVYGKFHGKKIGFYGIYSSNVMEVEMLSWVGLRANKLENLFARKNNTKQLIYVPYIDFKSYLELDDDDHFVFSNNLWNKSYCDKIMNTNEGQPSVLSKLFDKTFADSTLVGRLPSQSFLRMTSNLVGRTCASSTKQLIGNKALMVSHFLKSSLGDLLTNKFFTAMESDTSYIDVSSFTSDYYKVQPNGIDSFDRLLFKIPYRTPSSGSLSTAGLRMLPAYEYVFAVNNCCGDLVDVTPPSNLQTVCTWCGSKIERVTEPEQAAKTAPETATDELFSESPLNDLYFSRMMYSRIPNSRRPIPQMTDYTNGPHPVPEGARVTLDDLAALSAQAAAQVRSQMGAMMGTIQGLTPNTVTIDDLPHLQPIQVLEEDGDEEDGDEEEEWEDDEWEDDDGEEL